MAETEHIVRKSEFAAMRNVSPGRVTQWITAGHIGPEALSGEGRDARIRVAVAEAHLRERLDPSQRFGLNGLATRLETPQLQQAPAPAPVPVDTVEARIKLEKLRQSELATRRAEEADRESRGIYVLASAAREEWTRAAAKLLEAIDGSLADTASEFAAKYQIPSRDALHLLRASLKRIRGTVAADFAALAEGEPALIDDTARYDTLQ